MKTLHNIILSALLVFSPIKAVVITTLVLVLADMITGILASKKSGIPITSAGFKKTVGKIMLYEIALLLAFLAETYLTTSILPVCKLVSALVGLTEIKSIMENLDIIHGQTFFAGLVNKIVQSEKDNLEK